MQIPTCCAQCRHALNAAHMHGLSLSACHTAPCSQCRFHTHLAEGEHGHLRLFRLLRTQQASIGALQGWRLQGWESAAAWWCLACWLCSSAESAFALLVCSPGHIMRRHRTIGLRHSDSVHIASQLDLPISAAKQIAVLVESVSSG